MIPPEDARRAAAEVLSRPAFREHEPGGLEQVRDAVLSWLADRLQILFDGGVAGAIAWLVLVVGLAGVAVLSWRLIVGMRRDGSAAPVGTARDTRGGPRPAELAARAEAHERAGRWREAVRDRFRELLARLVVAGRLEERRGRTVGEHRAALARTDADLAVHFDVASRLFEHAWYGHMPVGRDEVARLRRESERLRRALSS